MTHKLTNKIEISDTIFKNEYDYAYGNKKNELVYFYYCHNVKGMSKPHSMTYSKALNLAIERSMDGRYKNYTYYISEL